MYSSYSGGYGGQGYGGYSSYGMGNYGGMSSYGSYGSYGGMNRANSLNSNQQGIQDPNKPPQQQISQKKQIMQEYFKMMGGLRSMVQIGFSTVALCNFASRSWELLKRIVLFLSKASKKLMMKLSGSSVLVQKMSQVYEKSMLLSPNTKNGKTLLNKVFVALRISAVIMLLIAVKLKNRLNTQVQVEHDIALRQYQQVKLQQKYLKQVDAQLHDQHHHKQGYF